MYSADAPRRRFRITIRLAASESRRIDAAAKHAGLTRSAYARAALIGAKPLRAGRRPPIEAVLLGQLLDRVGMIATDLQEIARRVSSGLLMPILERELAKALKELRACRAAILQALGRRPGAS